MIKNCEDLKASIVEMKQKIADAEKRITESEKEMDAVCINFITLIIFYYNLQYLSTVIFHIWCKIGMH